MYDGSVGFDVGRRVDDVVRLRCDGRTGYGRSSYGSVVMYRRCLRRSSYDDGQVRRRVRPMSCTTSGRVGRRVTTGLSWVMVQVMTNDGRRFDKEVRLQGCFMYGCLTAGHVRTITVTVHMYDGRSVGLRSVGHVRLYGFTVSVTVYG